MASSWRQMQNLPGGVGINCWKRFRHRYRTRLRVVCFKIIHISYLKFKIKPYICSIFRRYLNLFVWIKVAGRGWHIGKGVYLTLWFWLIGISQILNIRQKQSNGECLSGYVYVLLCYIGRDDWYSVRSYIHIGVRLSRCSFRRIGQCESLNGWDGQQVQALTLFVFNRL